METLQMFMLGQTESKWLCRWLSNSHETGFQLGNQKNLMETRPQVRTIPAQCCDLPQGGQRDVTLVSDNDYSVLQTNVR